MCLELEQTIEPLDIDLQEINSITYKMEIYIVSRYLKKEASLNFKYIYKKFFSKRQRKEIIYQIKLDLVKRNIDISSIELEVLSNNIYDFCCLMVHKISPDEIIKYITYKNNYYCNKLSYKDKNIILDNQMLKNFTELKNKYIKILKEKQIKE